MIWIILLVVAGLVLTAIRYAYSGADNALYYAKGKSDAPELPHIHDAEQNQSIAAYWGHAALLGALCLASPAFGWWAYVGMLISLFGVTVIGDYHFNKFIIRATGKDTARWYWPRLGIDVPKFFAGRRTWQPIVGVALFFGGAILWLS